jgi:FkbM family methyltransferase
MAKSLAKVVSAFAYLISSPLGTFRRKATRITASEFLQETLLVNTPNGPLSFFTPSRRALITAKSFLDNEPETLKWIDAIPLGGVLWDIGANVGEFAVYAGKRGGIRVLAFEPAPSNYYVLCRNIEINGIAETVDAYCLALGDTTALETLKMANTGVGHSRHSIDDRHIPLGEGQKPYGQSVVCISADRFAEEFAAPTPTHIKLDVDGIDDQILVGSNNIMTSGRVQSVLIELEDDVASRIHSIMDRFGYQIFAEHRTKLSYFHVDYRRP